MLSAAATALKQTDKNENFHCLSCFAVLQLHEQNKDTVPHFQSSVSQNSASQTDLQPKQLMAC